MSNYPNSMHHKRIEYLESEVRGLEATVDRLIDRIDKLEPAVIYLCEQDGDVVFVPVDPTIPRR